MSSHATDLAVYAKSSSSSIELNRNRHIVDSCSSFDAVVGRLMHRSRLMQRHVACQSFVVVIIIITFIAAADCAAAS